MALSTVVDKASANSFELVFPIVPGGADLSSNKELTLNIFSTIIPGVTMDMTEHRWMGAKTTRATGALTFEEWNFMFTVDEEFKNWQALWTWMAWINNNHDKFLENHHDYTVNATLRVVNNFQQEIFKLLFVDAWVNNLAEISLSHREGEQNLECSANLIYDRFEIQA